MRFSIIIPVYNSASYLKRTLDSVCNQKYVDYEIICINDGSTDNSLEILQEYQIIYSNLRIYNQPNCGPSVARNVGMDKAVGEYIMFCDSDDWYERDTILAELDEYIKKHKKMVDVVFFPGNTNWGGNVVNCEGYNEESYSTGWEKLDHYVLNNQGSFLFIGAIYAYCYRTKVIRENKIEFNTNTSFGEDRLFVFDFLYKSQYTIVYPKSCYYYNVRPGSLVTSKTNTINKLNDAYFVAKKLIEKYYSRKQNRNIKRSIAQYYMNAILSLISIGQDVVVEYKWTLISSITTIPTFIKVCVLCVSPKLFKKIFHND